jgi:hypothetical protein
MHLHIGGILVSNRPNKYSHHSESLPPSLFLHLWKLLEHRLTQNTLYDGRLSIDVSSVTVFRLREKENKIEGFDFSKVFGTWKKLI